MLSRRPAVGLVLTSILSVQVGAAFAKSLFGSVPPLAVSWLRLTTGALVLLFAAQPWRRLPRRDDADTRRRWLLLAWFAVALVGMNVCIYLAFERLPIGLAVTLEFLGPLGVAAAGFRRVLDVVWVALAGIGVALLGLSPGSLHATGVVFALCAAAAWAAYIVAGARMGGTWRGVDALAWSCLAGALVTAPLALPGAGPGLWTPRVLIVGAAVGLLSTVLPYSFELAALRRIPAPVFGILMSLEPSAAALAALLVLHEGLTALQAFAMACVIAASIGATRSRRA